MHLKATQLLKQILSKAQEKLFQTRWRVTLFSRQRESREAFSVTFVWKKVPSVFRAQTCWAAELRA